MQPIVQMLGRIVNQGIAHAHHDKIDDIKDYPITTARKELPSFLVW